VISTSKAAELRGDRGELALGELGRRARRQTEGLEGRRHARFATLVTLSDAGRDPVAQQAVERSEVVGQLGRREARLRRHHAAADVDAHRRGQECVLGGNDAADGCSQAEVCVRHQADGSGEDRQPRGPHSLLEGVVVELAGP
jgi:hypothetical protein